MTQAIEKRQKGESVKVFHQKQRRQLIALFFLFALSLSMGVHYPSEAKPQGNIHKGFGAGTEQVEILIHMAEQSDTDTIAFQAQQARSSSIDLDRWKTETRQAVAESLQKAAAEGQAALLQYLEEKAKVGDVSEIESFFIVNMVFARVSPSLILEISERPDVKHIYPNTTVELVEPGKDFLLALQDQGEAVSWNIAHIGAPEVWARHGIDGKGVVIGIIDTGVMLEHPAVIHSWRGQVSDIVSASYNWYDPIYQRPFPDDQQGHGTKVAGIILGSDQPNNITIGAAPGAQWIAVRGLNDSGVGDRRTLLSAGQYMLAPTDSNGENPEPALAPDIVINAWGDSSGRDDWYREMVQNWRNANIFPVFAAGNFGPIENTICNPANYPESFAVGATDSQNQLASFSSRGPGAYGEMIKPEIVAPGVQVFTSTPRGYGFVSGTSMSAAHIAGVAALLIAKKPSLLALELEEILKQTAVPLTADDYPNSPNYGFGHGLVDASAAVNRLAADLPVKFENMLIIGNMGFTTDYIRTYRKDARVGINAALQEDPTHLFIWA